MDIIDGIDVIFSAMNTFPPKICFIFDFYPKYFRKVKKDEPRRRKLSTDFQYCPRRGKVTGELRSAEQFEMLAKMGLAVKKENN